MQQVVYKLFKWLQLQPQQNSNNHKIKTTLA